MADYRLPFDFDTDWQLWNGNWDDSLSGHGDDPFLDGSQAYAFDFGHKHDATGRNIRAARAGTVAAFRNDLTQNTSAWTDEDWARIPEDQRPAVGGGSHVLIRHNDQTVAAYCHMKSNQSFISFVGQHINRGQVIGLADKTGSASAPHVHFDVRLFWNDYTDIGRTLPIQFEDRNHECWRPRVGDVLASNNS
jgi:murein DD-endopeptidase MepM/ murein hydrolase activator NlpD